MAVCPSSSPSYDVSYNPTTTLSLSFPLPLLHTHSGWWHVVLNLDFTVALTQNLGYHPKGIEGIYKDFLDWDELSAKVWWEWQARHRGEHPLNPEIVTPKAL
jgi:hypothetical protein